VLVGILVQVLIGTSYQLEKKKFFIKNALETLSDKVVSVKCHSPIFPRNIRRNLNVPYYQINKLCGKIK
jgi:hypothetical protein